MNYIAEYEKWLNAVDADTKEELKELNDSEIKDAFYKNLEFGTGGLRGVLGAGTNRMNKYVIARATQGLANYIIKNTTDLSDESVAIAYDSRNFSSFFAEVASGVLNSNGIKTYIFDSLRPTPELSFAVRYLSATAGIVITASHNPKEYNGYKVYWSDGGQVPPHVASEILAEINDIDMFDVDMKPANSLQTIIGDEVDEAYLTEVYKQSVNKDVNKDGFRLVYTPLHGSGNKLVRGILEKSGFKDVIIVKEQELPDGNFPTVNSPNPENKECFEMAIELAKANNVDLIIGTDPDSDRMGIVVRNKSGEYVTMTGNQVGVMLTDYILSSSALPEDGAVISTIVSTPMAKKIAENYGIRYISTLTGFKFIGEKIYEFERDGSGTFMFGFEESYGYLKGTYCRDKDAVVASMLTAEMAAYYAEKGLTLYEVMNGLYEKFGGYYEDLQSITLTGIEGMDKMKSIMGYFRNDMPNTFIGEQVTKITDYLGDTDLPKSDVISVELQSGITFVVRPSGTEPKIKIYYLSTAETYDAAKSKAERLKAEVTSLIEKTVK